MLIREQNLRVMLLVLFPLAGFAFLSQGFELVASNRVYLGLPLTILIFGLLIGLVALTHFSRAVLAEWLLVFMLVPITVATTIASPYQESYSILEVAIAVTLSAILLPRWAMFLASSLCMVAIGLGWLYKTTIETPPSPVVLLLFAYSAIMLPLTVLIYYLRLLFDRQILLLQSANEITRQALIEARAANESQARFLATMSHELRTPLNAIRGNTDLLLLGYYDGGAPASGKPHELLSSVQRSTIRLLTLINEILDIARLEAGRDMVQLGVVNVRELITDALEGQRFVAHKKGIALNFSATADAPQTVTSDAAMLSKIVHNLIGNAVKFTEHGAVTVTLASDEDHGWRFRVEDTGISIAPDHLGKIFERFYQVDSGETRQYQGSGLGLAIVKELVERLGGHIRVESRQNAGTAFVVKLPQHELMIVSEQLPYE